MLNGEELKVIQGDTYCCLRTGLADARDGRVVADMRVVDGFFDVDEAKFIATAVNYHKQILGALNNAREALERGANDTLDGRNSALEIRHLMEKMETEA